MRVAVVRIWQQHLAIVELQHCSCRCGCISCMLFSVFCCLNPDLRDGRDGDNEDVDDNNDDDGDSHDEYHDEVGCHGTCIYGFIGASMEYV